MSDPYKRFMELADKDYPGRLPPVNRKKEEEKSDEVAEVEWDSKPVVYNHGGKAREFFTIRHLAMALNRSPVTIRSWEKRGVLPKSPFRSPAPSGSPIQGNKPKGKRLWTREQIEGLLQIASKTGCIVDEKQSPPNAQFTSQASQLFTSILQKETNS